MSTPQLRPGGRSARVQESVHRAVRSFLADGQRDELTVPMVATRAGVTPSTIYRRWGDLPSLLADVAVERMRPDTGPLDTGHLQSDLKAWAQQYYEEMSSVPGRAMMRDVIASSDERRPMQCSALIREQMQVLVDRAMQRASPDTSASVGSLAESRAPALSTAALEVPSEAPSKAAAATMSERSVACMIDRLMDHLVAPLVYRLLYESQPMSEDWIKCLVEESLRMRPI